MCLSVHRYVRLSLCLSVCLSVCLPVCLSVCPLSLCPSIYMSLSLSVYEYLCLCLSVCLYVLVCLICVCRRRVCLLLTPLLVYLAVLVLPSSPLDLVSSSSFYSTHVVCTRDVTELLKSTSIRFGFCVLCFKSVGFECRFAK